MLISKLYKEYLFILFLHLSYIMSRHPQFNVNNEHQLIRRQNTYVLDRKLVTVHSEDRDVNKWPCSNHFEVTIPQDITNVQSMRLVEINLPGNHYTFSNSQQNTKLSFSIQPNPGSPLYIWLVSIGIITIEIPEGFYSSANDMALELQNAMNKAVTDIIHFCSPFPPTPPIGYANFKVLYDKVSQKIYFGNTYDGFTLVFDKREIYDTISYPTMNSLPCNPITKNPCEPMNEPSCQTMNKPGKNSDGPAKDAYGNIVKITKPIMSNGSSGAIVWEQYTNWGLPSYLGFAKESYVATGLDPSGCNTGSLFFNSSGYTWPTNPWLEVNTTLGNSGVASYVAAPFTINIFGDNVIYMELDKYNSIDEIKPYSNATNNTYNNDYNGRVKSAFAKIPITGGPPGQIFDSRNGFLQNISQYNPPIDRIRKIKVTFRYHDGRLVQFKDSDFSFTIAFNQLKDEIARDYEIRVPEEYRL